MRLVILGSGGYGHTVEDVAVQLGYECVFLDDSIPGHELSTFSTYLGSDVEYVVAFGNNEFRLEWINRLQSAGAALATIIHPSSYVSPTAVISPGTVILPKAVVNTGVVVERGCILNIGSIVDHDVVLEEAVHLAPGAIVKGENRVARCTKVESGEVIGARQFPLT